MNDTLIHSTSLMIGFLDKVIQMSIEEENLDDIRCRDMIVDLIMDDVRHNWNPPLDIDFDALEKLVRWRTSETLHLIELCKVLNEIDPERGVEMYHESLERHSWDVVDNFINRLRTNNE